MKWLTAFFGSLAVLPSVTKANISSLRLAKCGHDSCELDMTSVKAFDSDLPNSIINIFLEGRDYFFRKIPGVSAFHWYGEFGNATLNLLKKEGPSGLDLVFGHIVDGGLIYRISSDSSGVTRVISYHAKDFPEYAEPKEVPMRKVRNRDLMKENPGLTIQPSFGVDINGTSSVTTYAANTPSQYLLSRADDQGGNLDVMVVWTKRAECVNSFLSEGCRRNSVTTANMQGLVELSVQETNAAFAMSGIETTLRLVHCYAHPTYAEPSKKAYDQALDDITYGNIDGVHSKRAEYGADIVVFLIDDEKFCGNAWIGPEKEFMFSIVWYKCASSVYSFGHEIAHNLGCNHDRGSMDKCGSGEGSAYGWRDPQTEFRTIMALDCVDNLCKDNRRAECSRIQRFSNPNFLYNGKALGSTSNNNALQINNVKKQVAGYYPVKVESARIDPTLAPSKAPVMPSQPTTPAPTRFPCKNDLNWRGSIWFFTIRCQLVGFFPLLMCPMAGSDGRVAREGCPVACSRCR